MGRRRSLLHRKGSSPFKNHLKEFIKGKDREAWHRQIMKKEKNLCITREVGELNINFTQFSENKLVLECFYCIKGACIAESQPPEG